MVLLTFPYEKVGNKYLPIIPITLQHGFDKIKTVAYIDSGASISTFHSTIAELANINYKAGRVITPKGTAGDIKAYMIRVRLHGGF